MLFAAPIRKELLTGVNYGLSDICSALLYDKRQSLTSPVTIAVMSSS